MNEAQTKDSIELREVTSPSEMKSFIRFPASLYADDPNYVAPLEFELTARLNPEKNPTLKGNPHKLWIAYRNGEAVGRIGAIVNKAHLARHNDGAGHFGYFEAINDNAVADALLNQAAAWLKSEGMEKIAGPFNFSVNEEIGMLVDGFDTPPYIMMPHGRLYYPEMVENRGYTKAMDMVAFEYVPQDGFIPEKRQRFVDRALAKSDVTIRNLNMADFENDIQLVIDIFNDAWFENWGFIPFTKEQASHMAKELRPIIQPHNVVFCYLNDEPVAFGLVLPDVHNAIRDFNGKLFPFNWAKLLWRLKVKGMHRSRMPLMGVVRKLHGRPVGAALAYKIIQMVRDSNMERGVTHSELSWILENNESMVTMLQDLGARIYKTYRIYEKSL